MAQRTQVTLEDDLDGGPADQTVGFTVNGVGYELDLSSDNADRLEEALAPYIRAARRVPPRTASRAGKAVPARRAGYGPDRAQLRAIRDWAKATGQPVSDRGRIPTDVVAAFEAAHG